LKSALAALASLLGLRCAKGPAARYVLAADPGSRSGFEYVRDRTTGRWLYREFELRVDTLRPLPDPLTDEASGTRLSLQLLKPGSAQTGGLRSAEPRTADGYRVWSGADVIGREDVDGKVAYGITVSWPREGVETRYDPMEVFPLPALGTTEPEVWSPWARAASLQEGALGWWKQVHGEPPGPLPEPAHPFEFRWRLVPTDVPGRIP
jgi:hypothetical protein